MNNLYLPSHLIVDILSRIQLLTVTGSYHKTQILSTLISSKYLYNQIKTHNYLEMVPFVYLMGNTMVNPKFNMKASIFYYKLVDKLCDLDIYYLHHYQFMCNAVCFGRIKLIKWLHKRSKTEQLFIPMGSIFREQGNPFDPSSCYFYYHRYVCDIAIECGELDIVKWLRFMDYPIKFNRCLDAAAKNGYNDVVSWLMNTEHIGPKYEGYSFVLLIEYALIYHLCNTNRKFLTERLGSNKVINKRLRKQTRSMRKDMLKCAFIRSWGVCDYHWYDKHLYKLTNLIDNCDISWEEITHMIKCV